MNCAYLFSAAALIMTFASASLVLDAQTKESALLGLDHLMKKTGVKVDRFARNVDVYSRTGEDVQSHD